MRRRAWHHRAGAAGRQLPQESMRVKQIPGIMIKQAGGIRMEEVAESTWNRR